MRQPCASFQSSVTNFQNYLSSHISYHVTAVHQVLDMDRKNLLLFYTYIIITITKTSKGASFQGGKSD